jgi:putative hemolysin
LDSDPVPLLLTSFASVSGTEMIVANLIILVLISCSALFSSSEIAYFSLTRAEVEELNESDDAADKRVAALLERPRYLLSTLLVANNMVNIGVVVTSYFVTRGIFDWLQLGEHIEVLGFLIPRYGIEFVWNVVVVTFILVLFGEATPKIFATHNKLKIARGMSAALTVLNRLFTPLNFLLVGSTRTLEKRLKRYNTEIDIEEINKAIEITVEGKESKQDAKLLKGIVFFGNIVVKQIMRPRREVSAIDSELNFHELMEFIREMGYSRYPVYKENIDTVIGVLNIKDLLAHTGELANFEWQKLVREPFFVPESKKIDDLLREIQENRKHLAVVVDEFGGTSGIITLEDIIEEVVGDIKDEFDEATDGEFRKLDDRNFLFEGKIQLMDACRYMDVPTDTFDEIRGEAETIGGLVLELAHRIPRNGESIKFENYKFTVITVQNNRIEKLKVTNEG